MGAQAPGIIPARAGFTGSGSRELWRLRGSSPLARGLPSPRGAGTRSRWDHPRSRGVYGFPSPSRESSTGSSPLARGLRGEHSLARHIGGIIPARAGFTNRPGGPCSWAWDHPRSRGVYRSAAACAAVSGGSSPLARGLQRPWEPRGRPIGIIPARAGFTHHDRDHDRRRGDHPRSRGVYVVIRPDAYALLGSSPLARGLHPAGRLVLGQPGIIPARAGFTYCSRGARRIARDHPRSRGVYSSILRARSGKQGSSPLARGLPGRGCRQGQSPRIIPARAGFTRGRHQGPVEPWDHPRSRGVYPIEDRDAIARFGSSPLARGLP